MKHYRVLLAALLVFLKLPVIAQDISFIALGDMHYDRLQDHDLKYVTSRPQDLRQIMDEYPQYTAFYLPEFLQLIKKQSAAIPNVKAVVQLGDLVEGVAGNAALARQMDRGVVDLLHDVNLPVPWVLTKGNHDVSNSPGQPEAWEEVIRPFIEGQVGKPIGHGMYTYSLSANTELFVLDQFFSIDRKVPETEMIAFLEKELSASKATYKFVLTHQPVIPVTQRCWHLLSGIRRPMQDTTLRERFLNMLAKNKVMVLCAHLHEYAVVSRKTASGNVVQVMINSVNRGPGAAVPRKESKEYRGEQWIDDDPKWEPSTAERRRKILAHEKKYITDFQIADLPGYAAISVLDNQHKVILNYYNGFAEQPYQSIDLSELQQTGRLNN
ncbi:metallophosphoesterase [Mucilaginibacter sp.]|uniref:metallophosphoesterase family protein n=1 Tax=Mucilaginibacter sp. TaxID=1882438 RepID=UPI002606A8E3|nr:metallophosphoesterase [Mucilaginibacter sp.]MDB4924231.1 metallophosphoesterase [Mucilaginibacter sp.]